MIITSHPRGVFPRVIYHWKGIKEDYATTTSIDSLGYHNYGRNSIKFKPL